MSNLKDSELLHHLQPRSLSKEGQGPFRNFPSSHGDALEEDGQAHDHDDDDASDDVLFILPKHHRNPELQRWKRATVVLNASRRSCYTTETPKEQRKVRLRTTTHAVRAALRFQQSYINEDTKGTAFSLQNHALDVASEPSAECFDALKTELMTGSREHTFASSHGHVFSVVSLPNQMASLVQQRIPHELEKLGSVEGLAHVLEASLDKGLKDDASYIQVRRDKFGPNTYPQQPSKPFHSCVFNACKDPTLTLLMVCALLALGFGIKSHGIKEGWYDGTGIAFAVMLEVLVTSVSDYRQSLQIRNLSEEKRNIPVHAIRGGRKMPVSIFDLVVGDLVSLSVGDQVPADGVFVDGHSLILDESSMTGESEPAQIDHKNPYLLSGCKVIDGYGTMLVTGVGMRTEWGHLMEELGKDHCKCA